MKRKYLNIAILSSMSFSMYAAATEYYTVVIGKEHNLYRHETASLLPQKDGANAVVKNENTNSRDSGDLFLENLSIESESGHLINISTDIKDRNFQELELKGNWTSNLSLSSSSNNKNGFSFVTPNYDGDILLTLNLSDGSNNKSLKAIIIENEHWISTTPNYTEWKFESVVEDWSPSLDSYFENESISQSRTIKRTRDKQEQELRPATGSLRNVGSKQEETDNDYVETRTSFGTKSYWESTDILITQDWTRDSSYVSSWTPSESLYFENENVPQTKEYRETKKTQEREYRPATDEYRNIGSEKLEERFNNDTRTVLGLKPYWESTDILVTQDWTRDNSYSSSWTPSESLYFENESVSQTKEYRETKRTQEREFRPKTGEYRNVGLELESERFGNDTQTVLGSKEYWIATDILVTQDWTRDNSYVSSWKPSASLYFENESVPQTKEYRETKKTQQREFRPKTSEYRNIGLEVESERYGNDTQTVSGSKPYWEVTSQRIVQDWTTDSSYSNYVWTPDVSSRYENESIPQTRERRDTKIVINQEYRPATDEYRDTGNQISSERFATENRTVNGALEYWEDAEPYVVSDWIIDNSYPSSWSPSSASYYENVDVNQQKEVKRVRTIRDREYRPATGEYRFTSSNKTDVSITTEYRTVKGDQEYWVNTGSSSCTDWEFSNNTVWTPSAAEYERTETVSQTRDRFETRQCSGQQHRPATNDYRYATAETESRTIQESRTTYGSKIDLNDWFTNDTRGNWSVSDDGTYVNQTINGNPTVFESAADTYGNVKISGVIKVGNDGDDDFVGMVLGKTDANNFIVWAWKRSNQTISGDIAYEGHYLGRVTGGVNKITWHMQKNSDGYQALDSNISTSIGWEYETYYSFDVIYTPTKVEVWVEGTKVLESSGSFDTGKIGFYNNSQSRVEYYKVVEESLD